MGAFRDLTGQKFGRWAVIEVNQERGGKRQSVMWKCECECGIKKLVNSNSLVQRKTTSCGKGKCKSGFSDLTGKIFGKWKVIELTKERRGKTFIWLCECACGNRKKVAGGSLSKGRSKSCGEYSCQPDFLDLTGQKFGKIAVIKYSIERIDGEITWECKCDCGYVKMIKGDNLRSTSNCGQRQCKTGYNDLTGKLFGKLVAVKYTHTIVNDYWDFYCSCGKTINILAHNVTKGHTKSCGCIKRKGELDSILKFAYRNHLRGAKNRNIGNYLSKGEYVSIASNSCHYCGHIDIRKNKQTGATLKMNGIDRKNNESYYKLENSIPCCRSCNTMKMSTSYNKFIKNIRIVAKYTENIKIDQEPKT
jgi:hypothetical protein